MKKYTNNNLEELFRHLETKLPKDRVEFLRDSIAPFAFENFECKGEKIDNIVIHRPSLKAWTLNPLVDGGYQQALDNPYIIQCCLESVMTEEENELANEWEDKIRREDQRRKYIEKVLEKSEKVEPNDWVDPVFEDDNFYCDIESWEESKLDNIQAENFEEFCGYFPEFLETSEFKPFLNRTDVRDFIDWQTQDVEDPDDVDGAIVGVDEFQEAYDKLLEKNKTKGLWHGNNKKVIMITEEYLKELWEIYEDN